MPFVKGDERINRSGRPKKEFALTNLLREKLPKDKFIDILIKKALEGDDSSIRMIMSYMEGNPSQRVEHTGEDGGPIVFVSAKELVEKYDGYKTNFSKQDN